MAPYLAMSLVLILTLSCQAPQSVTDIQARIPKSFCVVSVALTDWHEDHPKDHPLGDKLLMSGTMAPDDSMLTLIVEPNVPPVSPQTWRQRLAPAGKPFDVGATPCTDTTSEPVPGLKMSDYHAFFATRTHSLDLHVSGTPGAAPFPRAEFDRIVKSLRVLLLRRGWTEDYPEAIAAPMTVAAVLGVDQKEWRDGYLGKHAEDWAAHFANAEFLHDQKAPLDQQLAAYDKALALVAKGASPDPKTKFATAMLLEGRSLALYDAKRFADTIKPLEQACAILQELKHAERGGPAYNLACSHALCRHEAPAIAALTKAIEATPRYRESAATDADFAAIAKSAAFKKVVAAPPAEPAPAKKE
jgi:hypothetical protein